jgi:hypothetical protein
MQLAEYEQMKMAGNSKRMFNDQNNKRLYICRKIHTWSTAITKASKQ